MVINCKAVESWRIRENIGEGVFDVTPGPDLLRDGDQGGQVRDVRRCHLKLVLAT